MNLAALLGQMGLSSSAGNALGSLGMSGGAAGFPPNFWANAPHVPDATGHSMLDHPGQFENGYLSGTAFNIQDDGVNPPRGELIGLAGPSGFAGPVGTPGLGNPPESASSNPGSWGQHFGASLGRSMQQQGQGNASSKEAPALPDTAMRMMGLPGARHSSAILQRLLASLGQGGNYLGRLGQ